MHVFITGGTGIIGSAVVAELLSHGHTVLALARSDGSARAARSAGAEALRGGLADLEVLRAGAEQADGVIHLAFSNDFSSADAVAGRSRRRRPPSRRWAKPSSAATARSWRAPAPPGSPAARRPSTTRCPRRVRWAVAESRWPHPGAGGAGRPHQRSTAPSHGSQGRQRRLRRPTDPARPDHRGVRLSRRRHAALARRARPRRGSAVPARSGTCSGRHVVARGRRRGRCSARHRRGDRAPTRLARPARCRRRPSGRSAPSSRDQPASSAHTRVALGWQPTHPRLLRISRTSSRDGDDAARRPDLAQAVIQTAQTD